eukprot:11142133-Alexandrium_andersonii.AAC.1
MSGKKNLLPNAERRPRWGVRSLGSLPDIPREGPGDALRPGATPSVGAHGAATMVQHTRTSR